jgi:hypothetical protein
MRRQDRRRRRAVGGRRRSASRSAGKRAARPVAERRPAPERRRVVEHQRSRGGLHCGKRHPRGNHWRRIGVHFARARRLYDARAARMASVVRRWEGDRREDRAGAARAGASRRATARPLRDRVERACESLAPLAPDPTAMPPSGIGWSRSVVTSATVAPISIIAELATTPRAPDGTAPMPTNSSLELRCTRLANTPEQQANRFFTRTGWPLRDQPKSQNHNCSIREQQCSKTNHA